MSKYIVIPASLSFHQDDSRHPPEQVTAARNCGKYLTVNVMAALAENQEDAITVVMKDAREFLQGLLNFCPALKGSDFTLNYSSQPVDEQGRFYGSTHGAYSIRLKD